MLLYRVGNITIHINPEKLKKLSVTISWSSIVVIALVMSVVQLVYMDKLKMVQAIVISAIIGFVTYYYLLIYCSIFTGKIILGLNYFKFWRHTVIRKNSSCHQIKVVFFEEIFFRVIPIYAIKFFDTNSLFWIVFLTFIFVLTHIKLKQPNNLYSLLELFIFFFIITLTYVNNMFLPILFLPHFIRNVCVNEIIRCVREKKGDKTD